MKTIGRVSISLAVMCALIALALLASALQFASPVQASTNAAMSDSNCHSKNSCCDMDKNDCAKEQICLAKCGGAPSLALLDRAAGQPVSDDGICFTEPDSLTARTSSPLRRPPRN
jgi:hypothetical protein